MGAAAGQLDLIVLGWRGDPNTGDEVHLQVGKDDPKNEKLTPFTVIVQHPSLYDSRVFREKNRVVLSEEGGALQLSEVYCGSNCVYSAKG